jgi:hypothetical protein
MNKMTSLEALAAVQEDPYNLANIQDPPLEVVRTALARDGYTLQYVREQDQDRDTCRIAVLQNPDAFRFVRECRTDDFVAKAIQYKPIDDKATALKTVKEDGLLLQLVTCQTPELCLAAVKQNGDALLFVQDQTPELCLAAVQQDGSALKYVPETHWQDRNFCLAALNVPLRDEHVDYICGFITDWTNEEALLVAAYEGRIIKHIKNLTTELCLTAVKSVGYALQYVPETLRTPELCLAAVQQACGALKYVPETLQTPELYLAAVKQKGKALKYVPEMLQTPELCLAAMQQDGDAFEYVPEALREHVRKAAGI